MINRRLMRFILLSKLSLLTRFISLSETLRRKKIIRICPTEILGWFLLRRCENCFRTKLRVSRLCKKLDFLTRIDGR